VRGCGQERVNLAAPFISSLAGSQGPQAGYLGAYLLQWGGDVTTGQPCRLHSSRVSDSCGATPAAQRRGGPSAGSGGDALLAGALALERPGAKRGIRKTGGARTLPVIGEPQSPPWVKIQNAKTSRAPRRRNGQDQVSPAQPGLGQKPWELALTPVSFLCSRSPHKLQPSHYSGRRAILNSSSLNSPALAFDLSWSLLVQTGSRLRLEANFNRV
jgi:hypothetical protein